MKPNRTILWVALFISAFAFGFLAVRLIQMHDDSTVQSGQVPALPSPPK